MDPGSKEINVTYRNAFLVATSGICLSVAVAVVSADTLVMRDGRRIQGQLVAVRDGTIDFDGPRGRVRVDRSDITRIELDDSDFNRPGSNPGTPSRPSGLREREINVDAKAAWTDTGLTVRAGQTVYFNASGRVRWGPGRQDGPAGEKGSPRNESRPMPSRPSAALIGRIGESQDYFLIGDDTGPIRVRESGRLFLGTNDDYLQDNSGSFRVTVFY
jgi:hypothetical protein